MCTSPGEARVRTDFWTTPLSSTARLGASSGWARYDGPGSGEDDAKGLVVDSSGNAIVTGYSLSAATAYDDATIKYDTLGNELWVARYDGQASAYDLASAIALDSVGNVFVTGFSSGAGTNFDYATIKYDSNGNQVWVGRYDGPGHMGDYATAIALDSSGNVHVTGRSVDGTGNWSDYATIRYSPDGVQTRESQGTMVQAAKATLVFAA